VLISTTCEYCRSPISRRTGSSMYFCNTDCKAEWQKLQRPVSVDWLRQKYSDEGMDCTQIAAIVGRDSKSVWNWLKGRGIPTRRRGENSAVHFQKGQKSAFAGRSHTNESRALFREIAIATGRVPYDPAVGSYMKGRTGASNPNWKGGITPEREAVAGTRQWKEAVKAVWTRDNATCQRCKLDHRTIVRGSIAFDIHHIVGFACVELRCEVSNLVLLCEPCHYWVHSRKNKNKEFIK
jgi:hypothetical protein